MYTNLIRCKALLTVQYLKVAAGIRLHSSLRVYALYGSLFICCLACFPSLLQAQAPVLFFKEISKDVVSPVAITSAGDGTGRLFIGEAGGAIQIYKNGSILAKPFLNIAAGFPDQIISAIAFHPAYSKNRKFFVYTYDVLHTTITIRSFLASNKNPDSAILSSGKVVYTKTSTSPKSNHTMGDIHFGNDGFLYISVGDGSPINGLNNLAQNGQSVFGKMLRIDINNPNPPYYKIPADNPFVADSTVLDEIWSIGLRNAWRWSFDRKKGDSGLLTLARIVLKKLTSRQLANPKALISDGLAMKATLHSTQQAASQKTAIHFLFLLTHMIVLGKML